MRKKKLIQYHELVKEWDWKKNYEVDINKITYGMQKKFWWVCKKNDSHKWQASVSNRTTKNSGCPFCANQRVHKDNNLKALYPNIASEWHTKKNKGLKPEGINAKTQIKYWWKCKNGHEWEAQVYMRTIRNTKCPYCANQKVSDTNNLEFQYPQIAKEFDLKKNRNETPRTIVSKSVKDFWWRCKKNHSYLSTPGNRVNGRGCPYCAGKKVDQSNSLETLFPKIAKEWNYKKNLKLLPGKITSASNKKVWWKCKNGHEWLTSISSRTGRKTNCPYCSNKKVNDENNLMKLFPLISDEWHPTKNGKLKPDQIVPGSNKIVWWKCKNGHEWRTDPNHRTGIRRTGCPRCSNRISSFELRLLSELGGILKNVIPIYKLKGVEIDLFLKNQKIGIEYDGWYYHKQRYKQDKFKNNFLSKQKISLIRLREKPLKKIGLNDILITQNKLTKNDLNLVIEKIIKISDINKNIFTEYLSKKNFQFQKEYQKYLSFYPSPIPQSSLKQSHPKLIKQWDYEKNHPLKPENFYTNSSSRVWWRCNKGHSWKIRIAHRTSKKGTGCPYCAGKIINEENSLETLFPNIAQEFHRTKNGEFKPKDLSPGSHKKYWWKCKDGHEWRAIIKSRTEQKTGCPYCAGQLATKENNFKKLFPNLMKEWHPTKNRNIDPSKLKPGSNRKVWWQCKKDHSWFAPIVRRTSTKSGCVYCANLKVSKTNNLQAVSPELASEWHPTKNKPVKPKDIIARTGKKYWWKCKNGHEFKVAPSNRLKKNYISKCIKCIQMRL